MYYSKDKLQGGKNGRNKRIWKRIKKNKKLYNIISNQPKYLVSAKTGISLDIIDVLIENGLLEEREGVLRATNIRRKLNLDERSKIINGMENYEKNSLTTSKSLEKSEESKLVVDLRNMKEQNKDDDYER